MRAHRSLVTARDIYRTANATTFIIPSTLGVVHTFDPFQYMQSMLSSDDPLDHSTRVYKRIILIKLITETLLIRSKYLHE